MGTHAFMPFAEGIFSFIVHYFPLFLMADCFYLDMNGIIHNATHPGDADISAGVSKKDMISGTQLKRTPSRLYCNCIDPRSRDIQLY
jgi:hypothetical protein